MKPQTRVRSQSRIIALTSIATLAMAACGGPTPQGLSQRSSQGTETASAYDPHTADCSASFIAHFNDHSATVNAGLRTEFNFSEGSPRFLALQSIAEFEKAYNGVVCVTADASDPDKKPITLDVNSVIFTWRHLLTQPQPQPVATAAPSPEATPMPVETPAATAAAVETPAALETPTPVETPNPVETSTPIEPEPVVPELAPIDFRIAPSKTQIQPREIVAVSDAELRAHVVPMPPSFARAIDVAALAAATPKVPKTKPAKATDVIANPAANSAAKAGSTITAPTTAGSPTRGAVTASTAASANPANPANPTMVSAVPKAIAPYVNPAREVDIASLPGGIQLNVAHAAEFNRALNNGKTMVVQDGAVIPKERAVRGRPLCMFESKGKAAYSIAGRIPMYTRASGGAVDGISKSGTQIAMMCIRPGSRSGSWKLKDLDGVFKGVANISKID